MENLIEKAKKVRMVLVDVDGILTDGGLFLGNNNIELKRFNSQDGLGITIARMAGIKVGIITGRESDLVAVRAKELKMDYISQGHFDKRIPLKEIVENNNVEYDEIAYIGDDILDIPVLKMVGFSATAGNGVPEVKEIVDYVSKNSGGNGAVRDIIEFILKSQNKWEETINRLLEEK